MLFKKLFLRWYSSRVIFLIFLSIDFFRKFLLWIFQSVECWCEDSYGKYGQFSNDCNFKFSGNKNQECGGGWRNSIYSLLSDDIPTDIGSTRGIACEGQTLNLQCPQSQNLNIVSAYYGRTDSKMCGIWPNTIIKSDQLVYFQSKCNNNNSCSAIASNGLFGDICGGIRKYLGNYFI